MHVENWPVHPTERKAEEGPEDADLKATCQVAGPVRAGVIRLRADPATRAATTTQHAFRNRRGDTRQKKNRQLAYERAMTARGLKPYIGGSD